MIRFIQGDCRQGLKALPERSVHCIVTSPPYFGLRDYGTATWSGGDPLCDHKQGRPGAGRADGIVDERAQRNRDGVGAMGGDCKRCGAIRVDSQIGLEPTPDAYVAEMVAVFRELWRVLRDDGVAWLNLGDSYNAAGRVGHGTRVGYKQGSNRASATGADHTRASCDTLKPKDLLMIPARVAIALQADGWWLRSKVIWAKPNPMPESCTDRPTSSYEEVFLLTKSGDATYWTHRDGGGSRTRPAPDYRWINRETGEELSAPRPGMSMIGDKTWRRLNLWSAHDYFYDAEAVKEEAIYPGGANAPDKIKSPYGQGFTRKALHGPTYERHRSSIPGGQSLEVKPSGTRNLRNVWTIATVPFSGAHFAVFPPTLVERCVKAGTSERGACPACGAPWERVIQKLSAPESMFTERAAPTDELVHSGMRVDGKMRGVGQKLQDWRDANPARTTGWQPTCACPDNKPAPCVVLDPFSGAGTTALVADRLGRDAIGIDLNPTYGTIAHNRLVADAGLFAEIQS